MVRARRRREGARRSCACETLHAIEAGGNETAQIAELISTAVLRRHLETMQRLDIEYDFLPRESEILHLHSGTLAFEQLKEKGRAVLRDRRQEQRLLGDAARRNRRAEPERIAQRDIRMKMPKVIVRSNGTVDLCRQRHRLSPVEVWPAGQATSAIASSSSIRTHTSAGFRPSTASRSIRTSATSQAIYNVIDSRQADPQSNVIEALRGMGYTDAGRPLHALFLRDGRAHAALRGRAGLHAFGRRPRRVRTSKSPGAKDSE